MSLNMNSYSRTGLAICLALGLASGGCATWNKMIGKADQPSPKLNLAWAKLKESEGNLTSARHGYEEVLAKDPRNADAVLGMARLNVKAKRLVEAEEGFEKALALKPNSTEYLSEVGNFYSDQQRWDKAIPLLQEAQRLEPHETKFQFNLAVALAKSGQIQESIPHFKEAVSEGAAHYNVGRILIEQGKPQDAEEQFVIALAKEPNLVDAQFFLDEIRASKSGRAQQLPVVADSARRNNPAQQVAGTASLKTAEVENPFEEAPTSGFSQSQRLPARPVRNSRATHYETAPSGRQPLYPHGGYEELSAPPDDSATTSYYEVPSEADAGSGIVQASAEMPAKPRPPLRIPPQRLLRVPNPNGTLTD